MSDALARVEAAYREVDRLSKMNIPYVFGGGHNSAFAPDPGFDCSSFVSHVFHHAGILGIPHVWFPMDTHALANWGQPGPGQYMTMWVINTAQQEHCGLEFHIFNEHQFPNTFAQAEHPGTVVGWLTMDTKGFSARHWSGA